MRCRAAGVTQTRSLGRATRQPYRHIHVMLQRQRIEKNLKKLRRLYREEKLQVRKREGRKRFGHQTTYRCAQRRQ